MPAGERKSPTTIQYDEHDAVLYAKKTSLVSAATIYAVVNSGTGGTSSTDDAAFTVGTDAGTPFMALVDETSPDQADEGDVGVPRMTPNRILYTQGFSSATIYAVVNTAAAGQSSIVLDDSVASIGFATVNVVNTARSITGNVTLSDAKTYIGLVTSTPASPTTVTHAGLITLAPLSNIGFATVNTANIARTITGNVTLSDSKTFIGLVTAWTRNAGTTKTLVPFPVGLGNNSLSTIAVPTNANKINVTNLILSSNITTEVAILSGVTYLTGNASLGVTLFPGGGFELPGSPDSPAWIGLPSGAMVIEKRDSGGTVSKIGGGVIYFDE